MYLLLRAVTGNSTKKSIETNSIGAQGNSYTPILPGLSSYKPNHQKSSRMRL